MATIDMEQLDGVVGCFCTLLYPRRGQTEGTIVEDLGCEVIGKSSVSCPLKPSDSAPLKHSTMPP